METLVLVSQPRSPYGSRSRSTFSDGFTTPSPGTFGGSSCRAWQSGAGILPSPSVFAYSVPSLSSPRSEPPNRSRKRNAITVKASSRPVISRPVSSRAVINWEVNVCADDLPGCELWAGPAYSNSPPPSSLPMPKFCVSQKRAAPPESSDFGSDLNVRPAAKSTPTSPGGQSSASAGSSFVNALATSTLCRALNLDFADE